MKPSSEKVFLQRIIPTEEDPVSDHKRIAHALQERGYEPVRFPLPALRQLYPLCRERNLSPTQTWTDTLR